MLVLLIIVTFCWGAQCQQYDTVVAQDGSGNYKTIGEAILAAPDNSVTRFHIKIKAGLYAETIVIGTQKTNIGLIGEGMDITIISGNKSNAQGINTYDTATIGIRGSGFTAKFITFQNTAGPYGRQAVAVRNEADKSAFYQCRFRGYQDTLYTKINVQFYRECEIYGTVDMIFGDATALFQNCLILAHLPINLQKNTITAQNRNASTSTTGLVLQNCTITAAQDLLPQKQNVKTFMGRPWGEFSRTVIMESFLDDLIDPKGWLEWEGQTFQGVYYAEYNNRGPGAGTRGRVPWAMMINNSTEAAHFTARNFIQADKWVPSTGIPFLPDLQRNRVPN